MESSAPAIVHHGAVQIADSGAGPRPAPRPVAAETWHQIDAAYGARADGPVPVGDPWLLTQTVATAGQRRLLLNSLGIGPGSTVLDAGCGYGPATVEIATLVPSRVLGLDLSDEKVTVASAIARELQGAGVFQPGSTVEFTVGDLCRIDMADSSVDAAFSRFVLEYLPDPGVAVEELARVVRSGGLCCLVDVEDALSITYPEPSAAMGRLQEAFAVMQRAKGIDRHVGRKLAGHLDRAGFDVHAVLVLSQGAYGASTPADPARRFLVERFTALADDLVELGGIGRDELDACLGEVAAETVHGTCMIEGHVAAVGRRRA
jgi:ubiquinone/menaquinone biosynthesis C-methylase UbiE